MVYLWDEMMILEALKQLKTAFILFVILTILTGVIYPAVITGIAQLFFPWTANGSLVEREGKVIGSALIGQLFDSNQYFWGRPSATLPYPYNAAQSSGSNFGVNNPEFLAKVKLRIALLHKHQPPNNALVPVDLVTASGSGLDPDISLFAALYQAPRIARERRVSEKEIKTLILNLSKNKYFPYLEEPRVNVLALNLALDKL